VLLAVALMLALAPAAAAGQAASQPDLIIVGRNGSGFTGDDLYSTAAIGQTRSVVVQEQTKMRLRIQNDGTESTLFRVTASPPEAGYQIRFVQGRRDVTVEAVAGTFEFDDVPPGKTRSVSVVIDARAAEFGSQILIVILVSAPQRGEVSPGDAVHIRATKVSTE
jgi:hypothetical protein